MGYELHIARKSDWDTDEDSNISLDEWLSYVHKDEELKLTNGFQMNIPNVDTSWKERPGFCEWTAHPKANDGILPWFDYWRGSISTKYPDDFTIRKMLEIAQSLNARVQGDDDEFYDQRYFLERGGHEEPTNTIDLKNEKKPWWKIW
jgi:hypothetical protein